MTTRETYDGIEERRAVEQSERMVESSRQFDRIERAPYSAALADALLGRDDLEDHADGGHEVEYWGPGYRIHLVRA